MKKCIKYLTSVLFAVIMCAVLVPFSAHADETWSEAVTLSSDKTVIGDLYITKDVNLKGYNLTVTGSIFQTDGKLSVGSGKLTVKGDYIIANKSGKQYTSAWGWLEMDNSKGVADIAGSFIRSGNNSNTLSAGTMKVGGNFIQKGYPVYCKSGYTIEFTGEKTKHSIELESGDSYLDIVYVNDGGSISCSDAYLAIKQLCSDVTIYQSGNTAISELGLEGVKCTITGNDTVFMPKRDIWLNNGAELNIEGTLNQTDGKLKVGAGKLNISGDYIIAGVAGKQYTPVWGCLEMENSKGVTDIAGSFIRSGSGSNTLSAGTMKVGGNFIQKGYPVYCKSGYTIEFSGKRKHKVELESADSYLDIVYVNDGGSISCSDAYLAIKQLCSDVTVYSSGNMAISELGLNGVKCTVTGNDTVFMPKRDIWLNNGAELNIEGTLNQTDGKLKVGAGKLNISGDYIVAGVAGKQYTPVWGCLEMENSKGVTDIAGSFIRSGSGSNTLSAGTMKVGGSFIQKGYPVYCKSGYIIEFSGKTKHKVELESADSYLDIVYVNDGGSISCSDAYIGIRKLCSDVTIYSSGNMGISELGLEGVKCTIAGNDTVFMSKRDIWLNNGAVLTIEGSLNQTDGKLKVNAGRVNIYGDYIIAGITGKQYTPVWGCLEMENSKGIIDIAGNFIRSGSGSNTFSAGIMYLGGDFRQLGSPIYCKSGFSVEFTGQTKHNAEFSSPNSYFDFVQINPGDTVICQSDIRIKGSLSINEGVLDLNGYTVAVSGDLNQVGGEIIENGGKLSVLGKTTYKKGTGAVPAVTPRPTSSPEPDDEPKPTDDPEPTKTPVADDEDDEDDEEDLIDISDCDITVANATYTGKAKKATVKVYYDGEKLVKNVDYTVKYSNNTNVGKATVVITGIGDFEGSETKTFKVLPGKPQVSDVFEAEDGRSVIIEWDKVKGADGYEIRYSTKKTKGYKKLVTVKKKTEYSTKKIRENMYIKMRAYTVVNGKKYYSAYSVAYRYTD